MGGGVPQHFYAKTGYIDESLCSAASVKCMLVCKRSVDIHHNFRIDSNDWAKKATL